MLISELMRGLGRILGQHGDRHLYCQGRSATEFERGELIAFDGYALGYGLAMAKESGLRSFFRTVSPPSTSVPTDLLCFATVMHLPRGIDWERPSCLSEYKGSVRTLWVSPEFVRVVRDAARNLKGGEMTEYTLWQSLDEEGRDNRLIEEVAAAVEILIDCGVLERQGSRLKLLRL